MLLETSAGSMCRSPGSGIGSSHGRFRSLGALSSAAFCASLSSRRSFASADCVIAARCSEPSGFFTIFTGDRCTWCIDWPARNAGAASFSSMSTSSSTASSAGSTPVSSS